MVYRDHWKFSYKIVDLLAASKVKVSFHEERLKFWDDAKTKVMTTIKAEGLEISESVAQGYSNSGRDASVMVRVDLQRDLNECSQKITEHRGKVQDYKAWVEVLGSQPPLNTQELSKDDWLYFHGKK